MTVYPNVGVSNGVGVTYVVMESALNGIGGLKKHASRDSNVAS